VSRPRPDTGVEWFMKLTWTSFTLVGPLFAHFAQRSIGPCDYTASVPKLHFVCLFVQRNI